MVAQTPAFKKAVEDSRKLKAKPNNDELLEVLNRLFFPSFPCYCSMLLGVLYADLILPYVQLYAHYKQGTGEDFSKATQPGTFAFQVRPTVLPPS